ncbi:MAG: class I SAM-dependent methyltransferase [Alphaproteobacteria bacterium]|nr:class I SAM-dependent methyltransferase [Alphaproteobacteria bacterium]MCW5741550.1 class I SAM-dependent methyltransferase [Alphaproteobacteria bacterium]
MSDTAMAEAYERDLVPNVFRPWAEAVIEPLGLRAGQHVLDVACGTGIAARTAARHVGASGSVVGVDNNEAMLEVARRAPSEPGASPIEWLCADACRLPYRDAMFDLVTCFEGLQFFPDRSRALDGFRRLLRRRGRFTGTSWGPIEQNPGYQALSEGLARFVSADAGRLTSFVFSHPDEIHTLLTQAGFVDVHVEARHLVRRVPSARSFIGWIASGAPYSRQRLALLSEKDREGFLEHVDLRLARYVHDEGLMMPFVRYVFFGSV